ncbi:SRPBCC family protein [Streptomyces sp. 1331.2]|uniref:SRPBCC family protein n=1 Tax=Streptomyces sp. 1331.2 TaxID=1938835 RepID=UPI000BDBCA48|nr:SRPBCC family protein [Streptomyces sp. 1331.2]SOB80485.1 Polyketide cyclase / dehydrase and lipid transport [Streptomyces sp. 1331.2]
MDPNHYRFRGSWRLAAPTSAVYAALEDVRSYPLWWPEISEVRPTGEETGDVVVRALLPYRLVISLEVRRRDPAAGVLEAAMRGDLNGWSRFTVTPNGPGGPDGEGGTGRASGAGGAGGVGCRVLFEEDTRPGKPLLRRLALPLHPVFRANHAVMMLRGRRGLAAYLAAGVTGASGGDR